MNIGLFGGTFDPIHNGHLIILQTVLNYFNIDKIIVLPTSNPPHKLSKNKTPTKYRVEMTYEAIKDNPKLSLSTYESSNEKIHYSYETIRYFKQKFSNDDIYYIMGEDSFRDIETRYHYEDLIFENKIIIFSRYEEKTAELESKMNFYKDKSKGLYLLNEFITTISSTKIRKMIREGMDTTYLLPDSVKFIIDKRGLYGKKSV